MSNNTPADIINGLDDEDRLELLEYLAEDLGYNLTEAADPQSDVIEVVEEAIQALQKELGALKAQFADGAEPEYAELERVAESIEVVVAELSEAHANLNAVMESDFDVEDDDAN